MLNVSSMTISSYQYFCCVEKYQFAVHKNIYWLIPHRSCVYTQEERITSVKNEGLLNIYSGSTWVCTITSITLHANVTITGMLAKINIRSVKSVTLFCLIVDFLKFISYKVENLYQVVWWYVSPGLSTALGKFAYKNIYEKNAVYGNYLFKCVKI